MRGNISKPLFLSFIIISSWLALENQAKASSNIKSNSSKAFRGCDSCDSQFFDLSPIGFVEFFNQFNGFLPVGLQDIEQTSTEHPVEAEFNKQALFLLKFRTGLSPPL